MVGSDLTRGVRSIAWVACILSLGALGCSASAVGPVLMMPGRSPTQAMMAAMTWTGDPPPAVAMCMEGEPGCIETGWGPGWDRDRSREGRMLGHWATGRSASRAATERSSRTGAAFAGPCRLYWESDLDLGTAPLGDCRSGVERATDGR